MADIHTRPVQTLKIINYFDIKQYEGYEKIFYYFWAMN